MDTEQVERVLQRLDRIEVAIGELLDQRMAKEWYSTADVAKILGRSEYTVREWCRKRQVEAKKAPNGRGWLLSHAQLQRLRNFGPAPELKR